MRSGTEQGMVSYPWAVPLFLISAGKNMFYAGEHPLHPSDFGCI
jgi:hypothetical protein